MKRPNKADRAFVARHLRREAAELQETAQRNRLRALADKRPDVAEYSCKVASQLETRAERFQRVADWMEADQITPPSQTAWP